MPVVQRPSYEFSSNPRAVKTRPKFRPVPYVDDNSGRQHYDQSFPVNIHHDPRIARGNTFAGEIRRRGAPAASGPQAPQPTPKTIDEDLGRWRSRRSAASFFDQTFSRPSTRGEIDLSRFLIEPGEDEVRSEHNTDTQTDEFHERPETPDLVPKKTGVDVSTQIEPSDKVFDFDHEVQPLLAVLVGKTLEQARIQVEREHELDGIRQAALELNRDRENEARRVSTLKEVAVAAQRAKEELRRRRREEAAARRVAKEKVACLQLMRQVLPLSLEAALAELTEKSWTTPTAQQIKTIFMPSVLDRMAVETERNAAVRDILLSLHHTVDEMAEAARKQRMETRRHSSEALAEARRAALQKTIRLFLPAELVGGGKGGERQGPVDVRAGNTVQEAEAIVRGWVVKNAGEGGGEEGSSVIIPVGGFLAGYLRKAKALARRNGGANGGGGVLGVQSTLLEVQERSRVTSDEILLEHIAY